MNDIHIAQNHNLTASVGITICTLSDILRPWTLYLSEEKPDILKEQTSPLTDIVKR